MKKLNLSPELLETRLTPAGQIALTAGVLTVFGDGGANAVDVRTDGQGNVNVRVDNLTQTFATAGITRAFISTGAGNDDVFTNLAVPTVIDLGAGNDRSNVLHGAGATVFGGQGNDALYQIIGAGNVADGGAGRDIVYTNVQSFIVPDAADQNPIIFGQAVNQGFTLINGVVYYVPGQGDNRILIQNVGGQLLFTSSVNGQVTDVQAFGRGVVTDFATVLGSGNDVLINQVKGLNLTAYGAGGNDTLIAGPAGRVLFKGGNGNDVLDASQAKDGDVTGDPGNDVLAGGVVRTDGLDLVSVNRGGRLVLAA
jgi:hypothetical protein